MATKLKPQQALAMFSIVFARSEEERRPKMGDWLKAADRDELARARLIELEKDGRCKRVILTDAGWQWAAENLQASLPQKNRAARVLERVLIRLGPHLASSGASLARFAAMTSANDQVGSRSARPAASSKQTSLKVSASVPERIRKTALELGGGEPRIRVRLRELRSHLPDIAREQLDRELIELQRVGTLVLYRIDDPSDVTKEDERAALHVAGYPRHILYLER